MANELYRRSESGRYGDEGKKKKKEPKKKKNPYSANPLSGERDKYIAWELKKQGG